MNKKRGKWAISFFCGMFLLLNISPALVGHKPSSDQETQAIQEAESLSQVSIEMLDGAIELLSKGLSGMDPDQREQFERIFDPSQTGDIDEAFVEKVLQNYRKIRRRFDDKLSFKYEADSDMCHLMRLYYTDLVKIHLCPYVNQEENMDRKARVLIHEVAHMALWVVDRPYYDPKSYSTRYNALTPKGPWMAQIPLIGPVFREIYRCDTLYHPDTYSWFAAQLFQPGESKLSS